MNLIVLGTLRLAQVDRPAPARLPTILSPSIDCGSPSVTPIPEWFAPFDSWYCSEANGVRYVEIGPG